MVQIGLRPEDIRLAPSGAGRIPAVFDFAEELGSGRLYHFKVDDLSVTVQSSERVAFKSGDVAGLVIEPGKVHLFDAATTRRIDHDALAPAKVPTGERASA
jgi:ABC-type sugar transport system ATPase subunit